MITDIKKYFAQNYHAEHALRSPPHITLIPPFNWPNEREDVLAKVLRDFVPAQRAFRVTVDGFGAFKPRVIYAAVELSEALQTVQKSLSDHLQEHTDLDFKKEEDKKAFHPHMTVAFRDLKSKEFYPAWQEFKDRVIRFDFMAEAITLLKHNGKYWEEMEAFRFGE